MARRIIRPADPQTVDKKMVAPMVQSWETRSRYWASLEEPFRRLLSSLADDRVGATEAWSETLYRAAMRAFDTTTRNAAGFNDRELRGRVAGRGILFGALRKMGIAPEPAREEAA